MTTYDSMSQRLTAALALGDSPVAIRFGDTAASTTNAPTAPVAAGCSFWELGAKRTLVTTAAHHQHCSIGIHTHNLVGATERHADELNNALAARQGLDYVRPEEVANLPVMTKASEQVSYAPLGECDEPPDVVLLFVNAHQGLIVTEAAARVDGAMPMTMGRPACALIPAVINLSLIHI